MCKAFTADEVIVNVDPEDDHQNMMSWFNAKYEYIPPDTNTDIIIVMSQILIKCSQTKFQYPWESSASTPNPMNQYMTPVSYIFADYKKSYHGQDKVKNFADFQRIFAQQTQLVKRF